MIFSIKQCGVSFKKRVNSNIDTGSSIKIKYKINCEIDIIKVSSFVPAWVSCQGHLPLCS